MCGFLDYSIDRILCARGQKAFYDSDELYAFFQQLSPERIATLWQKMWNNSGTY